MYIDETPALDRASTCARARGAWRASAASSA